MKRFLLIFLCLLLAINVFGLIQIDTRNIEQVRAEEVVTYSNDDDEVAKQLCVIGSASISIKPDSASVQCYIETLDKDLNKSKDDNFEIFDNTVSMLKDLLVEEENIIFGSFSSYPSFDYSQGKNLIGYYCNTTFSVEAESLENLQSLVDCLSQCGVNIQYIQYKLSNQTEYYNEVLLKAIEDAKSKAQIISGRDDLTVKNITEEAMYSNTSIYRNYCDGLDSSIVGCVDLQARVVVIFE